MHIYFYKCIGFFENQLIKSAFFDLIFFQSWIYYIILIKYIKKLYIENWSIVTNNF